MAALPPEAGDGFPDRVVVGRRVAVDVAGVGEFGEGGGGDEVDFRMGEVFEVGQGEFARQRVDFGVLEELGPRVVDRGVRLERPRRELARVVFACVEVFEEAGYGF